VLSPTSTCHTFDASADGYGRADAIGALYLKRLSDAVRDNDPIRSVIRATSVNSNGQTPGITLPSAKNQEAVIARAYEFAGIHPGDTDYFECHGTGTPVGDPIEVSAVANFYAREIQGSHRAPLLVGSAKPSFGHSEAASGITSIIKATLALENLQIPATVGIKHLNPNIPWQEYNIQVAQSLVPWPRSNLASHIPRASINSFGYGGANAHCVLDRAANWIQRYDILNRYLTNINNGHLNALIGSQIGHFPSHHIDDIDSIDIDGLDPYDYSVTRFEKSLLSFDVEKAVVLPFSARNQESLEGRIQGLSSMDLSKVNIQDLAYTLTERRSQFEWRGFVVAKKSSLANDINPTLFHTTIQKSEEARSLAFVFTGQGAQWPQMGKELFKSYSTFRDTILSLEHHLASLPRYPSWSLSEAILASSDKTNIHHPSVSQTACTAVQIALVDLLRHWDIRPNIVIGHSSGEIAAAYAAGHMSSFYAIEIAYLRGQVVSSNKQQGAMMAVGMGSEEAQKFLDQYGASREACVACVNSPENVTISGDSLVIESLLSLLQHQGKFARKLKTGGQAYHSHHMKSLGTAYEYQLRDAQEREYGYTELFPYGSKAGTIQSEVTMISTVFNRPVSQQETSRPSYWRSNLESPVLFSSGIEQVLEMEQPIFIEVGPHSALKLPVKQTETLFQGNSEKVSPYLSILSRNASSETTALTMVGQLWALGHPIKFQRINRAKQHINRTPTVIHNLPNYNWNHSELLWTEPRVSLEYRQRKFPSDELLGALVPGSNGRTFTWRNLLDVANVPWVADHKLSGNIVLPGACYIAMAVRASQQLATETEGSVIEIRNVQIERVLLLDSQSKLEVFTELVPRKLTDLNDYSLSWHFTISSFVDNRSTKHASGDIEFISTTNVVPISAPAAIDATEQQANRVWYSQFSKSGLEFGPTFQSLSDVSVPRSQKMLAAEAHIRELPQAVLNEHRSLYSYDIHPIVIDAAFQTGLIATASGNVEQLSGKVPIFLERMQIHPGSGSSTFSNYKARATAKLVGPGVALGHIELLNGDDSPSMRISSIKVAPLQGSVLTEPSRHPMLKVLWTPDIQMNRLGSKALSDCLTGHLSLIANQNAGQTGYIASILQLLSYVSPNLKILELTPYKKATTEIFSTHLDGNSLHQRFELYTTTTVSEQGELEFHHISGDGLPEPEALMGSGMKGTQLTGNYDIIISMEPLESNLFLQEGQIMLSKLLSPEGYLLIAGETKTRLISGIELDLTHIPLPQPDMSVSIASRSKFSGESSVSKEILQAAEVTIVVKDEHHPLNELLLQKLLSKQGNTTMVKLEDFQPESLQPRSTIIMTVELEQPILTNMSSQELLSLQKITDAASQLLWITGGNLIESKNPELSTALGLSRSVMSGNPAIRFVVLDIDKPRDDIDHTISNIEAVLLASSTNGSDYEYLQKDGVLHVSRLIPDKSSNDTFEQKKLSRSKHIALKDAGHVEVNIREPGQFDTIEFTQVTPLLEIPPDYVEVMVKAAGMNAKDLYTLSGKIDTIANTCSCEFSGIITRLGSNVTNFAVGDRVVSSAPGRYRTYESVPASVCYKISDNESFTEMAGVPMVYGTAIHALQNLANLQAGESVLIHSAAGGVGTAAIRLAQDIGAQVFATVGNDKKKAQLVEQHGIDPANIFNSRDTSFLPAILKATNGKGVDVVLNSLTGERLHASLEACSKFGRFIEIGKRDLLDAGNLNMRIFLQGITFSAFDLHELYYADSPKHRATYSSLLSRAIELYRRLPQLESTKTNTAVFDISQIGSAFRFFANASRTGKVALSFEDPSAVLPVVAPKYTAKFSPNKSYLLIGCLGGLGRSISRYMLLNGAQHFTFLGRSGTDKPSAADLVSDLELQGATVNVIRGDVCDPIAVQTAVSACTADKPLGGVIQAAMGLTESLFPTMTHTGWHAALGPKIQGTWNIHHAIAKHEAELDFFLMTSSIAGSIGFSTESNYCAANCFLDHFAGYRQALGLKACSIGFGPISGVGIVHEHPEIEQIFFRGGITEVSEDDVLVVLDTALSSSSSSSSSSSPSLSQDQDSRSTQLSLERRNNHAQTNAHFLTGLEPTRAKRGFENSFEMLSVDPRLSILTSSHKRFQSAAASSTNSSSSHTSSGSKSGLPNAVTSALETLTKTSSTQPPSKSSLEALKSAIAADLAVQLSKLVLTPPEKIEPGLYLTDVGMDSTLAAQFKTYVFRSLGVDVPFVALMDAKTRVGDLAESVGKTLLDRATAAK
jgi:acyl transferase domain-containing protein/NADPH:quinone reductase-like Zn-dependent oxidoreductase/NADP-dependent 3-hydroxy acid dehydrogenase YdfG